MKSAREGKKPLQRKLPSFLAAIILQPLLGLAGGSSDSAKSGEKAVMPTKTSSGAGLDVLYAIIGIVAAVLLALFFYKMWQKKKREEQHARLLRLFEEDDELELELGLRD